MCRWQLEWLQLFADALGESVLTKDEEGHVRAQAQAEGLQFGAPQAGAP